MAFTEEEETLLKANEIDMQKLRTNNQLHQIHTAQMMMDDEKQQKGMFKEQLDLSDELDTIEHLLRGHILKRDANGSRDWVESGDSDMEILTEHGIYLLMNTLMFYLNKDTLLSNYDTETINSKMYDFGIDLADTIFMECEKIFKQPTFEECREVLVERIKKKTEMRKFAYELIGHEVDEKGEKEIQISFIMEIEDKVEKEMNLIREQLMKNKYKRFLILMRQIQDIVHSTYLRAYGGQERKTLRQHTHVSENINPSPMPQKPRKINALNWGH